MRILRALAIGVTLVYTGLCAFLYFDQEHFIFFPGGMDYLTPMAYHIPYQEVWIPASTHLEKSAAPEKLHGWWIPQAVSGPGTAPSLPRRVLLYLHGNGGSVSSNLDHAVQLRNDGASVLIVDYRSYGRSTSTSFPSEARVYEDAETAWQYLVHDKQIAPGEIIIYGHSLGGAIAIQLASRHPQAGGLIAESTFTSIEDMSGKEHIYSFFPIHLLLNQRFASLSKITKIKMPILFIHGTEDQVAPFHMSEQLFQAAAAPKQLVLIDGAGHEDCELVGGDIYKAAVVSFFKSTDDTRSQPPERRQ
jgi:pimeloyl-ACP methyl ester carboxylesterase